AGDPRAVPDFPHVQDGSQLAPVVRDQGGGRAQRVDHDGHARDVRDLAVPDGQAVDVERAAAEERRHAVQHTRLIQDACDKGVLHAFTPSFSDGRRIIACRSAPAGTMGYTDSSFSTRKSISAAAPEERTACTVGTTSSRRDTRCPAMPYAPARATKSGESIGVEA